MVLFMIHVNIWSSQFQGFSKELGEMDNDSGTALHDWHGHEL